MTVLSIYVRQNNILWAAYLLMYRIVSKHSLSIGNIRGNILRSTIGFFKIILLNIKDIILSHYVQIMIFPLFLLYLYYYNNSKLVFGDH